MQDPKGYTKEWIELYKGLLTIFFTFMGTQIAFWLAALQGAVTLSSFLVSIGLVGGIANIGILICLFCALARKIKKYGELK